MPKNRQQKEAILAQSSDRFNRAQAVTFVKLSGVKVGEIEVIRDALYTHGLQLQMAKNSLIKRALADKQIDVPAELLDQPLGMIFAYEDVVAGAKAVTPFVKEYAAFEILGGLLEDRFITIKQVEALANLPSREQLLGQLVGTIAAPLSGFVNVLQGNLRNLVNVVSAIRDAQA
jgi:large subunit ribosomal protein L10